MAYFKYVRRNEDSQIDWRTVSKSISDSLIAERDAREAKKAKIEENSRQYGIDLEDAPDAVLPTIGEFYMNFANDAKDYRLVQDNLLKSGILNVRDYTRNRQNLMDDTDRLKSVTESLNKEAEAKLARNQNLESAAQEMYEMELIQGFATFSESGVFIDPMTGRMSIAKRQVDENGNYTGGIDRNNTMTLDSLLKNLGRKVNRYDVQTGVQPFVDNLGEEINVLKRAGILRVSDIRDRELTDAERGAFNAYNATKNKFVDSVMSNPDVMSSLFSDTVAFVDGQQVTFTTNPDEAGGNVALLSPNKTSGLLEFNPTDEQRELIRQALSDQIDVMVDREEEATPIFAPQDGGGGGGTKPKRLDVTLISRLYGGNANEADTAANTLENYRNTQFNVTDVVRNDEGVTFTRIDNQSGEQVRQTFPFVTEQGIAKSEAEFDMEVASFLGEADIVRELQMADYQGYEQPSVLDMEISGRTQRGEIKPFDEIVALDTSNNVVNVAEAIDSAEDEEQGTAAARNVVAELPADKKARADVKTIPESEIQDYLNKGVLEPEYGATQVYLPEVMTAPVFIPADENYNSALREVMKLVYEASSGQVQGRDYLTPIDFQGLIPDFGSYNNPTVFEGLQVGVDWNNGNGDIAKFEAKRKTPRRTTTGGSAADFNP
jgi:hypothetical protein